MCILCTSEQKLTVGRGAGIGLCFSVKLKDRCFTVRVGPFYGCGNRAGQKAFHGNDIWYMGIWILGEKFLHFCCVVSKDSTVWFFCIFSPNCTSSMHCHFFLRESLWRIEEHKAQCSVQDSDCLSAGAMAMLAGMLKTSISNAFLIQVGKFFPCVLCVSYEP